MKLIQKILIANRGEIAIRVMDTCREMGINTVAVFSEADREALFAQEADEAIAIGGLQAAESYLVQDKIIDAAKKSGADAIHPGYGFLSENADFAKRCEHEGLIFIGPSAKAIEAMGDKKQAKAIVQKHKVPVIPGYDGADQSEKVLSAEAKKIGFPILLKASAGGGGKGMRIVREAKGLTKGIEAAKREAMNAFGNDTLLIEKYFESSRHIEVQIFGDNHGNIIHLLERECSIQRRYQKIIEESPSPALTPELREKITGAALKAAASIDYNNAGTVEFILDPKGDFYFLEINTRLQVEHPVTESITGLDLVRMQIEVAQGLPLSITQDEVQSYGHAIECRLYAEDPYNDFLPGTGKLETFEPYWASGARLDSGVESGSVIDIFYDPMIAKVIVHGENRLEAIQQMIATLQRTVLLGLTTNKHFLTEVLAEEDFVAGNFDTHFLDKHPELTEKTARDVTQLDNAAIAASLYRFAVRNEQRHSLKNVPNGWRNIFFQPQVDEYQFGQETFSIKYRNQGDSIEIWIRERAATAKIISGAKGKIVVEIDGHQQVYSLAISGDNIYVHHNEHESIQLQLLPPLPRSGKRESARRLCRPHARRSSKSAGKGRGQSEIRRWFDCSQFDEDGKHY